MRLATRYTRTWSGQFKTNLTVAFWRGDTYWKTGRPEDYTSLDSTVVSRPTSDRHFLEHSLFTEAEANYRYAATDWLRGALTAGASYEYLTYRMTASDITTRDAYAQSGNKFSQGIPIDLAAGQSYPKSTWLYGDMSERDTDEHNAGLFARKQLSIIDRVFLTGGIRFDTFKRIQENPVTGERAERTDSAFSPNLGWSSAILKTSSHRVNVFGGWGRGFSPVFRAVNNTQFADVKPETSESFEVGVKAELYGRLAEVTATAYQLDRKDIVAMNPATKLQENVGDWRIQGVETDLRLRPARNVLVYGALAARNPRIHKYLADSALEGNKIPAISSRMLTAGATYKTPFGLGAGTEVRVVSSFFGNEQNSFQLPAYTLWDAWIHYDHEDSYRIAFYVKNILNTDYYTAVFSGVKNGSAFVGQPQSYGATFSARF